METRLNILNRRDKSDRRTGGGEAGRSPASGSAGRSDNMFLDDKDDLIGTGKKPRRNRATPSTSKTKMKEANTDERIFMLKFYRHF